MSAGVVVGYERIGEAAADVELEAVIADRSVLVVPEPA